MAFATAYFVGARLGLELAFVNRSVTAVWPPAGMALATLLIFGIDLWPGVFAGAFLANLVTAGGVLTSAAIATGNTLEAVIGASLVVRFAAGLAAMREPGDIVKFGVLAGGLSTALGASLGVAILAASHRIPAGGIGMTWVTWWVGDSVSDLVVAPLILLWATRAIGRRQANTGPETALVWGAFGVALAVVFGGVAPRSLTNEPIAFLCTPLVLWIALRFGRRETATAVAAMSVAAIWGTLHGFGPFGHRAPDASLLLLQAYIGVTVMMSLVLAAGAAKRRESEDQLTKLAVHDPVTGLVNYRQLMQTLNLELRRAERSGRAFAIVFMDLDRLKRINDRFGHLAGTQALRRVADIIRASCRAMDTGARYGGDEFAIVLPETTAATANRIAARVARRIASSPREPRVTVSVGVAVYPDDGATAEALIGAADLLLYRAKASAHAIAVAPSADRPEHDASTR